MTAPTETTSEVARLLEVAANLDTAAASGLDVHLSNVYRADANGFRRAAIALIQKEIV